MHYQEASSLYNTYIHFYSYMVQYNSNVNDAKENLVLLNAEQDVFIDGASRAENMM